ncbi:MAG: 30S ribosome-binding factor RbfA [Candidatus Omnitrophota bacterium]
MSRIDKINHELQHQISTIIQQELSDPRIGFVTVISVSVSADLRHAKVYFTSMGDDKQIKDTAETLNSAAGYIRKLLGKRMLIKFIPEIKFIFDDTIQQNEKIDKALDKIRREENQ